MHKQLLLKFEDTATPDIARVLSFAARVSQMTAKYHNGNAVKVDAC